MRYGMAATLLLLTAGLTLMPTGPLVAEDAAQPKPACGDRLALIERRLAAAELPEQKQAYLHQIIEGARTLDQLGDAERCIDLADQLDGLLKNLS
jgi:hypothetical protein